MPNTACRIRRGFLASTLVVLAALPSTAALAEAPVRQGWWSASSALLTGLPAPTTAVDVPADGLLVEGGASAPTAYAALAYVLAPDAHPESLVLKVAEGTATTPGGTLVLHPLVSPQFGPTHGGSLAEAPEYDTGRSVTTTVNSDGRTFTFDDLDPLRPASGLAVAILPGAPGVRVVLARPDAASLTTSRRSERGPLGPPASASAPSTSSAAADDDDPGVAVDSSSLGGLVTDFSPPTPPLTNGFRSPQLAAGTGPTEPAVDADQPDDPGAVASAVDIRSVAAAPGGEVLRRFLIGLLILAATVAGVLWSFVGARDPGRRT